MNYFNQADRRYHIETDRERKVVGKCENCNQILTDDYTIYSDSETNLFCCLECALSCYGIDEYDGY